MDQQKRGVLLHISSLPAPEGIGNFGASARAFIDLLHGAGQRIWQVLPLGPVGASLSPYSSDSAYAGNPLFIDPRGLLRLGLLETVPASPGPAGNGIDYDAVKKYQDNILAAAFEKFTAMDSPAGYEQFLADNDWLGDYGLFSALKTYFGGLPWAQWPRDAADRETSALAYYRRLLRREIDYHCFVQYIFWQQWSELKSDAEAKDIEIIGDMPIYLAWDSCDVWADREYFCLDEAGYPAMLAGVPPDYFSATGQLWGNPVYDWPRLAADGFRWWQKRISYNLRHFHSLRLDHFRGFQAFWAVPAPAEDAIHGQWLPGPGATLFQGMSKQGKALPLIAEDLGLITPEVIQMKADLGLPGMQVWQFAAEAGAGALFRALAEKNTLFCTGTHDNDTLLGWYKSCLAEKPAVIRLLKKIFDLDPEKMSPESFVQRILAIASCSAADRLVIPAQDLLGLDSGERMNIPGTAAGNWQWRLKSLTEMEKALLAAAKW